MTILDVALENGFHSHEAFTRAFVRQFGVTPSRFRRIAFAQATRPMGGVALRRLFAGALRGYIDGSG